ncbi:Uncharacterised protein [Mycobacteroides abscessus subsp. abscessus]|nr:Uncharacterised protein [Mycobacteroides abscessus subsp. abscessus]
MCAAAVMRSTASASGKIGASGRPVASSIDPPTSPEAAASRMVIAMSPMVGPPFSKSADTGRCVAAAICAALASVSAWPIRLAPSRRPSAKASPALVVANAGKP